MLLPQPKADKPNWPKHILVNKLCALRKLPMHKKELDEWQNYSEKRTKSTQLLDVNAWGRQADEEIEWYAKIWWPIKKFTAEFKVT